MKKVYSLTITLFLLVMMTATLSSQTFYRSVADVDSFAYVTMNDKILILKRDTGNSFELLNVFPFSSNYIENRHNAAVILNEYLVVSSRDSVILFSISDKINPIEIDRIFIGEVGNIYSFGSFFIVHRHNDVPYPAVLFKIENDNIEFVNTLPLTRQLSSILYHNAIEATSYPYIYKYKTQSTTPGIIIIKYDSTLNTLDTVNVLNRSHNIAGFVANSSHLLTLHWYIDFEGNPQSYLSSDRIMGDTLTDHVNRASVGHIPLVEGWTMNDKYEYRNHLYQIPDLDRTQYISNISNDYNLQPFCLKNSVYRIGQNNFYYLHQLVGMNMTFKQFIMPTQPTTPNLVSPIDNQTLNGDTVSFIWHSSSPSITSYEINISTDSMFTTFIDTVVVDTFLTMTDLQMDEKYYWRVRAKNVMGWGNYSSIRTFTTTITDIDDIENKFDFSLEQNYPNPFNPSTKISWQSPVSSHQTLKVYDVLGREVATLVDEYRNVGSYEVEFDAKNLASGVYYYQLKVGEFIETKKMILIK